MPLRASARPLIECAPVLKTKSSPSSTNQIGTTWGRPSWRVVASLPVRVPSLTKARHSASSMRARAWREDTGHERPASGPLRRAARAVLHAHRRRRGRGARAARPAADRPRARQPRPAAAAGRARGAAGRARGLGRHARLPALPGPRRAARGDRRALPRRPRRRARPRPRGRRRAGDEDRDHARRAGLRGRGPGGRAARPRLPGLPVRRRAGAGAPAVALPLDAAAGWQPDFDALGDERPALVRPQLPVQPVRGVRGAGDLRGRRRVGARARQLAAQRPRLRLPGLRRAPRAQRARGRRRPRGGRRAVVALEGLRHGRLAGGLRGRQRGGRGAHPPAARPPAPPACRSRCSSASWRR